MFHLHIFHKLHVRFKADICIHFLRNLSFVFSIHKHKLNTFLKDYNFVIGWLMVVTADYLREGHATTRELPHVGMYLRKHNRLLINVQRNPWKIPNGYANERTMGSNTAPSVYQLREHIYIYISTGEPESNFLCPMKNHKL